jgi:hydrophobic/amphiphilic exporter-1 (mainly G- bacteria), HAE1 family
MIYAGVVLLGLISWLRMPRELFPNISFPQLVVVTRYGNAAPEEIENLITKIIEESVGTVPDLKRVSSLSKEGVSLVTLEFTWGTDMGFAHLSVREKIDQIKDRLPFESEEPIINRVNPFTHPMMILSLSGDLPLSGLTEIAKRVVKQRLQKVEGVASATLSGGQEREIAVVVDRARLEAYRVSLSATVDALRNTNLNYPAGTTQGTIVEYIVRTIGAFSNIGEIGRTAIALDRAHDAPEPEDGSRGRAVDPSERFIHLDDIAEIKNGFKQKTSFSRYNGQENVSVSILKQADANTIDTAKQVRAAVDELEALLPKGVRIRVAYDESAFIKTAVNGVFTDAFFGGILAFLVLYFFLRSVGDASIVSAAIPASALAIFVAMYFKGVSINMLSLAGLGLAIGNLVDNSIVVVENTARCRAGGRDPVEGAVQGAEEVGNSMVTASLTNVAVILPLLFAKGVAQQLFTDLFFASVGASLVSMVVALTLIPRLAAYPVRMPFFGRQEAPAPDLGADDGLVRRFRQGFSDEAHRSFLRRYTALLNWVIDHPKNVALLLGGLMAGSVFIVAFQDRTFLPKFDQGQFVIRVNMPVGTRLEVTNRVAEKIEVVLRGIREVKDVAVNVGSSGSESVEALGSHQAQCVVNLAASRFRRSTDDIITDLKKELEKAELEGAEVQYVLQDSVLASAFETAAPIVVEVKGPDLARLKQIADDVTAELAGVRGIYGVRSTYALPSAETRLEIDKVRAAGYGLSVSDIARTALIGIKGFVATTYKEGGQEVDVRVQLRPEDRATTDDIRRLTVRSPAGVMVPLAEIGTLGSARGPSEIKRVDQQRAIVISANVLKRSVSEVIDDVGRRIDALPQQADYNVVLKGESAQIRESFGGLAVALVFSILLIYMIMAAEFESFVQPLIIMSTVPFCLIGVAFTLFLTGTPLSAPVILGTIILGGLVVNNGIILIDFMNQARAQGAGDLRAVVLSGGATRLRPIVMTMLVSVLGVLPMALGLSEGSELSSPMATVTFGGLLVSAGLSLLVVPLLYYYFETWRLAGQPDSLPSAALAPAREQTL